MHGSIRDRLEDLLTAERPAVRQETSDHLSSCAECSAELQQMKSQAQLLHNLRPPEEVEPTPGFYARVMQKIEERTKDSIWAAFIYNPFSKRLVFASLTLAILLGTYLVDREEQDGHFSADSTIAQNDIESAEVTGNQAQQRDAVLVNFASYEEPVQ
jgi:hypothetical protein